MSLYAIVTIAWLSLPVALAAALATSGVSLRHLRGDAIAVGVLSVLFVVLYVGLRDASFHGLEYEDAFEYAYAANVFAHDPEARDLQLNPVCVEGSTSECQAYATLSHPIGLSTLLSWPVRFRGRCESCAGGASVLFMWLASVGVFVLLRIWDVRREFAAFGAILFISVPVAFALGGTTFAEPTSAGLIILCVILAELAANSRSSTMGRKGQRTRRMCLFTALVIALVLAIFVKRESLVLLVALPAGHALRAILEPRAPHVRSGFARCEPVLSASLVALGVSWVAGAHALFDLRDVQPTSDSSFSLGNLQEWGPSYGTHLFSGRFLALAPMALLGIAMSRRRTHALSLLPVVGGYIVLFLSFSQSYYAKRLGEVPYFHFERYTLEIAPLLAVLGAVGLAGVAESVGARINCRAWIVVVVIAASIVTGVGAVLGLRYRQTLSSEESHFRRAPIERVCPRIPDEASVITPEPVLFYLYCKRPVRVIAAEAVGEGISIGQLKDVEDTGDLYVWKDTRDRDVEARRYPNAASLVESSKLERISRTSDTSETFALYRLLRR
jgi:hypothetical protein